MKEFFVKNGATFVLRVAIYAAKVLALAICVGITWLVASGWDTNIHHPAIAIMLLVGMYLSIVPLFFALFQALKLLKLIDSNNTFSDLSVKALKYIKFSALALFALFSVVGLPFFYFWAQLTDAPGLVLIGMALAGATFVVAIFASVLQRVFQDAMTIKTENDLTV